MNNPAQRFQLFHLSAFSVAACLCAVAFLSNHALATERAAVVNKTKAAVEKQKNTAAKAANGKTGQRKTDQRKKPAAAKVITGKAFGNSSAVKQLASEIAHKHKLPAAWVQQQIAGARVLPQILQLVLPPSSPQVKNWHAYRARFLTECRIQTGARFWREHTLQLDRAFAQTGVDPRYIVGILGVETFYGQHQGQYKLIDALSTLSLNFPKEHPQAAERQGFFQDELGYFLKQQRAQPSGKPVLGSYAGASGWPQFMPSSAAKFAVDFDGDGRIDLSNSAADAIGSVANYFKAFGWHPGMPTHFAVDVQAVSEADLSSLLAPDIVPSWSASFLADKQAVLSDDGKRYYGPLALVQLHNASETPSYVAGTDNFFVITRYNRSSYYALAVIELGLAVENALADKTDSKSACK
jgi:membrane-bound lytic murein transglycosylase B